MYPEEKNNTWKWVVGIIVLIAIIVFAYMIWGPSKTEIVPDNTLNTVPTNDERIFSQRIVVTDQFPGNIVYVSSAELADAGFVAIYSDNAGQPGTLLGSQYFEKGINPGKITLTQPTVDGRTYYAVLYKDNGDRVFNSSTDTIIKDVQGREIIKAFKASSDVDENKG